MTTKHKNHGITPSLQLAASVKPQLSSLPEVLPTREAAAAINRKPQTLRLWACKGNGPIEPIRINGRLAWLVSDLHTLLIGGVK